MKSVNKIKIGDFCKTGSGGTPSRSNTAFFQNGTVPWVKSGELKNRFVTEVEEYITEEAIKKSSAKIVPKNSLLLAMYGATVGEVSQLIFDATTNQAICNILPDSKICDVNYLYRYLQFSKPLLLNRRVGGGQPNISQGVIKDLEVPLPPLPEQKRIAQILDKADELRQKRQQSIEKLDELLQATFIDMFGDPVTNPKEWEKETIEKVCKQVIDCPHSTPKWTESGEICLRTSNLGKGEWIWDDTRYIDTVQFEERTRRSKLFTGDIVLSREGTIGIAAIVEKDMNLSLGQRLVQLTPNTEIILSEFLLQVLLYDLDPIRITRLMVGSTSKHINVKDLRNLKIFIPPLELQEKWTVFSNKLRQQKQVLKKQLAQQENLFQSLQQRAFNGEL